MTHVHVEAEKNTKTAAEDDKMSTLNIVLVEPQIPQNTGNIARTCAITGARLHLVGPLGFVIDDKKLKRAGLDYWDKLDISYYTGLDDFFSKNEGVFYYFTTKGLHRHSDVEYPDGCYLVFGRATMMTFMNMTMKILKKKIP